MRCIGIIGAMEVEVATLKETLKDVQITRKASMEFYAGVLEGKKVVVVRSGIGKVNAAVCTQELPEASMQTSISEILLFLQTWFITIWMQLHSDIR